MPRPEDASKRSDPGLLQRVSALVELLTTLDQRLVKTFDAMERIAASSESVDSLATDGSDLVADIRSRLERLDERLHSDLDELKGALMDKIGDLDLAGLDSTQKAVHHIDRSITRVEALLEGLVESAPGFMTRRVREAAAETLIEPPPREETS